MKPRHVILLAGVVLLVAAGLVTQLTGNAPPEQAAEPRLPVAVATEPAILTDVAEPFEVGGYVRARAVATIASRITGEIRAVRVAPGDRVQAGAPLVVLDSRELTASETRMAASLVAARQAVALAKAENEAAEASLALAEATHRRISALHAKKSATPQELDQAVAGLRAAEARLESARARGLEAAAQVEAAAAGAEIARVAASYAVLTAPFDGIVTQKLVDVGNTALPGMPLVSLEDVGAFRLEVFVDESRAGLVAQNQVVEVALDIDGGSVMAGRVAEVARALDPGAHAFLVKIDLAAEPRLRSGMFGRARFAGPTHRALVVPASSLVRRGQLASVFVVEADGRAHMRLVTPAQPLGDRVEIRAGLDEGERVVVLPPPGLVDGTPVTERQGRT